MSAFSRYFTNIQIVYETGKPVSENYGDVVANFRPCGDFDKKDDYILCTVHHAKTGIFINSHKYYFKELAQILGGV